MTKNWKKLQLNKKNLNFFGIKNTIYLSIDLRKGGQSYKRSLQFSKENIQYFKTWNFLIFFYFCGPFLPSWIRIHWPDWMRIQSGSVILVPSITSADIGACWGRRTRWRACWPRPAAQSDLISPLSQSSGRGRCCFTSFPSRIYLFSKLSSLLKIKKRRNDHHMIETTV